MSRPRLVVACAIDPDVLPQIAAGKPVVDRAVGQHDVVLALRRLYGTAHLIRAGDDLAEAIAGIRRIAPDVVFNFAHVTLDREPWFAGVMDYLGVRYTGSAPLGIALSRDKVRSRELLRAAGVRVPRFVEIPPGGGVDLDLAPPLIVKPARLGGCSWGIRGDSVVASARAAIARARTLERELGVAAVCDEFVVGRELRVGVVEDAARGGFRVVGVTESLFPRAKPGWGFKSHAVRSNPRVREAQGVRSIVPELSRARAAELREIAETSARVLDVRGYASLDVRIDARDRVFVIEVNANPGLSRRSLIWTRPSFDRNIARIVEAARL